MKKSNFLILSILIIILSACQKDASIQQKDFAFIRTLDYEDNTINGITLVGEILDLGQEPITDYGFEYSLGSSEEYQSFSLKEEGVEIYDFRKRFTVEFLTNAKYRYRAYVKHKNTTVYGNEKRFHYKGNLDPIVYSMIPDIGTSGTIVKIEGNNFDNNPNNSSVSVDKKDARIISASKTHIEFEIPNGNSVGPVAVKVYTNGHVFILAKKFTYLEPQIEEVIIEGEKPGSIIKIIGENLLLNYDEVSVFFNDLSAAVLSSSQTEVIVVLPSNFHGYTEDIEIEELKLKLGTKEFIFPLEFTILSQWEKLQDTPISYMYRVPPPLIDNGFAYVFDNTFENNIIKYDFINEQWDYISVFPGPFADSYITFNSEGVLYKLDGISNRQFWTYNIAEDSWTEKEKPPIEFDYASHAIFNGKQYILTDKNEIWTYDFNNDIFERLADFQEVNSVTPILYVKNNKLFALSPNFTWEYSSSQDIWSQLYATINDIYSDSYKSIAFVLDNQVYSYFGYKHLYRYNENNSHWLFFCEYPWTQMQDYNATYFVYEDEAYFIVQDEEGYPNATSMYKFTGY